MKSKFFLFGIAVPMMLFFNACVNSPIKIDPANPHYFSYRNKPIVLITSDHHYGAIIDQDFNYVKFLDYLAANSMNLTRIYPGGMFEAPDKYQPGNPLGPVPGHQILPWARSLVTGANPLLAEPGKTSCKYDLDKWNPEYFTRLKAFVKYARAKNIIVEVPFFNGMYADCWPLNAMYSENNIQKVGQYPAIDCGLFTTADMRNKDVMKYQKAYIQKITRELNEYDNVIYDICDEPSLQGLPDGTIKFLPDSMVTPWITEMKDAFLQAEAALPNKHILGQTVQNLSPDLSAKSWCNWLPTEYCKPAEKALSLDYKCNKPIVNVESNYFGMSLTKNPYGVEAVRLEGWWFMLGGGAGCINLNGEYHRGQETGGSNTQTRIVPQKKILINFLNSLDLTAISRFNDFTCTSPGAVCNALAVPGSQYAFYLYHGVFEPEWGSHILSMPGNYTDTLILKNIPSGTYIVEWIDPVNGILKTSLNLDWKGGDLLLVTPAYTVDVAMRMKKR